jgi:hypothetical protein
MGSEQQGLGKVDKLKGTRGDGRRRFNSAIVYVWPFIVVSLGPLSRSHLGVGVTLEGSATSDRDQCMRLIIQSWV